MRISSKQYAQALLETLKQEEDKKNIDKILDQFVQVLAQNNDLSQKEQILRVFNRIWNREKGIVEAEIISAYPVSKELSKKLKEVINKEVGDKQVFIKEKTDSSIKGGVVIKFDDKIIDASLKERVKQLKNHLMEN